LMDELAGMFCAIKKEYIKKRRYIRAGPCRFQAYINYFQYKQAQPSIAGFDQRLFILFL
jgi:hypothetical protein